VGTDSVNNTVKLTIGVVCFLLAITALERRDERQRRDRREEDSRAPTQREHHTLRDAIRLYERQIKEQRAADERKARHDQFVLIISLATAITVVIYAGLTYLQWQATRESFTATQRAFVSAPGIESFIYQPVHPTDAAIGFSPTIRNDGATPTRDLRYVVNFAFSDGPLGPKFGFQDLPGVTVNKFPLGAHGSVNTNARAVTLETAQKLQSKSQVLSIYGEVDYADVFSSSHTLMYCIQLIGFSDKLDQPAWEPCENNRHNCSDDDCEGEPVSAALHIAPRTKP
jgi:hypothetical protein